MGPAPTQDAEPQAADGAPVSPGREEGREDVAAEMDTEGRSEDTLKDEEDEAAREKEETEEDGQGGEGLAESEAEGNGAAGAVQARSAFAVTVVPGSRERERSRRREGKENKPVEANASGKACS